MHSYDIILDLLVINQTQEPMYNLCLELATVGDLKLCERPQSYTLMPAEQKHVKANIKVSSTETGIVFGTIVYDATPTGGGASATPPTDRNCVVLNDIHIDIMDYIAPASCSDLTFRAMWAEFEWENKVAVNTDSPTSTPSSSMSSSDNEVPHAGVGARGRVGLPRRQPVRQVDFREDAAGQRPVEKRSDARSAATSAFAADAGYRALPRRQDHDQAEDRAALEPRGCGQSERNNEAKIPTVLKSRV